MGKENKALRLILLDPDEGVEDKFERTFNEPLDNALMTMVIKEVVEEVSRVFGPVFKRLAVENALRFEADMLGEEPP